MHPEQRRVAITYCCAMRFSHADSEGSSRINVKLVMVNMCTTNSVIKKEILCSEYTVRQEAGRVERQR